MAFQCKECNQMSVELTGCHHVVHVELLPELLHYDCCSFCMRELDIIDKMFILQVLKQHGFFNLGQGNWSCPDNYTESFIPERTGSPTDFSDHEADDLITFEASPETETSDLPHAESDAEPNGLPHAEPCAESDDWDAESLASTLEIDMSNDLEDDDEIEILYECID